MMQTNLPFPKSEVWRFQWAYRTCLSVLVIAIIAVFYTSDVFLTPNSLIFSVFITGMYVQFMFTLACLSN